MKSLKLHHLQVLRGVAALLVCIHHSRFLVNIANEDVVLDRLRGAIGVPLFFIISGFIMVYSTEKLTENRLQNARDFILKRLIRIIPLFYFSISLLLLIYHHNIVQYFTSDLPVLLKTMFFIPLFTEPEGPAYGFSFMYVSWSLNYEMLFYIIFAISLLFVRLRYHFVYALFIILIFCIPLLFKGNFTFSPETDYRFSPNFLNFLTNPILLLFLLGVSFGLTVKRLKPSGRVLYTLLTASCLLFAVYIMNGIPLFAGSDMIVCGLLVFSVLLLDYSNKTVKISRFIIYLGDISYSIYLMHPLVYIYLSNFVKKKGFTGIESSWYFVPAGIAIVILLSSLTYELIEKRFTNFLKSKVLKPAVLKRSAVAPSY